MKSPTSDLFNSTRLSLPVEGPVIFFVPFPRAASRRYRGVARRAHPPTAGPHAKNLGLKSPGDVYHPRARFLGSGGTQCRRVCYYYYYHYYYEYHHYYYYYYYFYFYYYY